MFRIKAAIMVISTLLLPTIALTPVLGEIAKHFPDVGATAIQMVMTLPALVAVPASLVSGRLSEWIGKKALAVGSVLVMLGGGALPLLLHGSMLPLLCSSFVIGVGMGVASTVAPALIAEYFEGKERGVLMGLQSTFVGVGATILGFFSGQLARIVWYYAYGVFAVCLPVAVIVSGLLFGPLLRRAGRYIITAGAGLAMVGIGIVGFAESLPLALLGGMFAGYSYAVVLSGGIFHVAQEADEAASAMAIAVYSSACMIGNFLSPLVVTNLASLFGGGARVRFYLAAGLLLCVLSANLLVERRRQAAPATL